ncbi:MAG: cupin domain-containing protein [Candidatus Vogelbacteria bacterium]|nr:cupin domain-containing protein [Candidatus Vogelbacteria bacterium]
MPKRRVRFLFAICGWSVNIITIPPSGVVLEHLHWIKEEVYIGLSGVGKLTIDGRTTKFSLGSIHHIPTGTSHGLTTEKGVRFLTLEGPTLPNDTIFGLNGPYPPRPPRSPASGRRGFLFNLNH